MFKMSKTRKYTRRFSASNPSSLFLLCQVLCNNVLGFLNCFSSLIWILHCVDQRALREPGASAQPPVSTCMQHRCTNQSSSPEWQHQCCMPRPGTILAATCDTFVIMRRGGNAVVHIRAACNPVHASASHPRIHTHGGCLDSVPGKTRQTS